MVAEETCKGLPILSSSLVWSSTGPGSCWAHGKRLPWLWFCAHGPGRAARCSCTHSLALGSCAGLWLCRHSGQRAAMGTELLDLSSCSWGLPSSQGHKLPDDATDPSHTRDTLPHGWRNPAGVGHHLPSGHVLASGTNCTHVASQPLAATWPGSFSAQQQPLFPFFLFFF